MMRIRCDNCQLEWTTKGPGHNVFYKYKHDDGSTAHILDMIPFWASQLDPKNLKSTQDQQYATSPEAGPARFAVMMFGPYGANDLDKAEYWEGFLVLLNKLGPRLLFQVGCRHPAGHTTLLSDDNDPSHGV